MNPSYDQLNQYTHYLESQVEKFTAFMLTQKKLNQQHLQLQQSMQLFFTKINRIDQKIKLIQINQKDNLLEIKKIKTQKQIVKTMELRLQNIQRQLSSIMNIDSNNSFDHVSKQSLMLQRNHDPKKQQKQQISPHFQEKDLSQIKKYFDSVFVKRQELESVVNKAKQDFDFRIKKLQIQIDKSKESFLKLTYHINSLSRNHTHQNVSKKQNKNENQAATQTTKDMNMESQNQQNIVTQKQLRKMQKKLQNFFSQKISQIATKKQKQQHETQSLATQKALKFKKMQEKYQRMTLEHSNPKETRSERKIDLSDRQYSSQKKISLFDNEILKERHLNQPDANEPKKGKNKSRSNKQSPIGMIDLDRYAKEKRNSNSRSQTKKMGKKRSPQRLKKVNLDYMLQ